jgi:hypothetical protein
VSARSLQLEVRMTKVISGGVLVLASALSSLSVSTALAQPGAPAAGGDTVIIIEPTVQAPPPPLPMVVQPAPMGAGPGASQPVAAGGAPQNENWNNVSHINGTPVPVGTRGEYLYRFRRTNISMNPVGWIMGFYGASLSYAFHDNIALKGDVTAFSEDGSGFTEFSLTAPLYFRRAYQGPFIEPGLMSREYDDGDSERGPQVMVGWHWTYDSGWNMAMAIGGGRDFSNDSDYDDEYGYEDEDDEPFFNGYFRVGYAF